MKIETMEEMDNLFPWPTPGNKPMSQPELDALRLRMRLCVRQPPAASTSVRHASLGSGGSAGC